MPDGITTAMIDRDSGQLADPGSANAIAEVFKVEDVTRLEQRAASVQTGQSKESFDIF
jgi:penicillin-binding protein 1A